MTYLPILLLAAMIVIGYLILRRSKSATVEQPLPTKLRTDLKFWYFLNFDAQNAETADHVNLVSEPGWFGVAATALSMREHGKPTILHLSTECYDWSDGTVIARSDAFSRVQATLSALQVAGVLGQVVGLYPIDEPDVPGKTDEQVLAMFATVRRAAAAFPELAGVKIYVCYANKGTFPGIGGADVVGMDDYPLGASVLTCPLFLKMLGLLRADQQHFVVPGGADPFKQDPEAFRRYAHNTPSCMGVMAFMWATQHPGTLAGIGTNGMAEKYRAVGLEICQQTAGAAG